MIKATLNQVNRSKGKVESQRQSHNSGSLLVNLEKLTVSVTVQDRKEQLLKKVDLNQLTS